MKSPEVGVLAVADRGLKADGLLRHLEHGTHALHGQVDLFGHLLGGGFTTVLLHKLLLHAHQLVDRLDHVDRDADRPRLVRDGAGDRLPNPPRRVGTELIAAPILELFHGLHQPHVAFLDEVEEGQPAVGVLLGDGDDEAQVGLDHLVLSLAGLVQPAQSSWYSLANSSGLSQNWSSSSVSLAA